METRVVNIADVEEPYADLKIRHARTEARLLVSVQASGQKTPLFVIAGSVPGRYALVDGHKRLRALKALKADVAQAHVWPLDAPEALVRSYRMQQGSWNALEEAALVEELHRQAKWPLRKIAGELERTEGWASRRLGLRKDLPSAVLEAVGQGKIGVYSAVKYLLPLARAKGPVAERLALKLSEGSFSTRQVRVLYEHCMQDNKSATERIVTDPATFLKALEASQAVMDLALSTSQNKHLERLRVMGNVCLGLVRDLPEHWAGISDSAKLIPVWQRCRECFGMLEKTVTDLSKRPAHA
jgi:ParB-like chromosome segregation protein Spo0J